MSNRSKLIAIILILLSVLFARFFYAKYKNQVEAYHQLFAELKGEKGTSKYYKDQYGITHNVLQVTNENFRVTKLVNDSLIRSVASRSGVKPKHVGDISSFTATKEGYRTFDVDSFLATLPKRSPDDTSHRIVSIPTDCNIDIKYNKYWHRSWFLGHKKWFVDVYSDDKSVKITNLKALHISDEYSLISIGVTVGISVPNWQPTLVVGLCYTPNFLRFKRRN